MVYNVRQLAGGTTCDWCRERSHTSTDMSPTLKGVVGGKDGEKTARERRRERKCEIEIEGERDSKRGRERE